MLEWGFLTARLLPAYLHVFLIGVKRSDLPSDLQGTWSTEIALGETATMAQEIVTAFTSQVRQASIVPSRILIAWPTWRAWIERQLGGDAAPDYLMLAGALLHSGQPAFYCGELPFLRDALERASKLTSGPPELQESVRISSAACRYNLGAELDQQFAVLKAIAATLQPPLDARIPHSALKDWLEVLRLDFLGLCDWKMASTTPIPAASKSYREQAKTAFQGAQTTLQSLQSTDEVAWHLWSGYILRNLGRTWAEVEDHVEAQNCFTKALEARQRAYSQLEAAGASAILLSQYYLEICAIETDLLAYGYKGAGERLEEVIESLKHHRRCTGAFGMWSLAMAEARRVCQRLSRDDLLRSLESLERL